MCVTKYEVLFSFSLSNPKFAILGHETSNAAQRFMVSGHLYSKTVCCESTGASIEVSDERHRWMHMICILPAIPADGASTDFLL